MATDVCRSLLAARCSLLAVNGSLPGVAWTLLSRHDSMTVLRLASLATVRAGIVSNQAAVRDLVLRGLNDPTWSPSADDALGIAHAFLARGDLETATSVVERFQNNRDRVRPRKYEAIAGWLRMACAEPPSGETQTADASFVLWDHQGLDPAMSPRNIAPFMDSLSALVALARLKASLRSDDAEVQSLCDQIAERIDGSSKRPFRGTVRLHAVPRQSSHLANIPVGTWALVSGPLVRRSKTAEARFPFDGRVLPIFTGVHVDADVLGRPGATDCLRASGPVGCADWNSVFLLRAAHVPAFFSGPAAPALSVAAVARGGSQLLESAPTARVRVSWSDSEVPTRSVGGNLSAALAGIDDLAAISQDARVVTGDTAAFWLARSMGLHVRLRVGRKRPVHDSEVDMSASRLRDLAATSDDRLHVVLSAILAGETEAQVRARWRDACAPAVAAAEQRAQSLPPLEPLTWSRHDLCAEVRRRSVVRDREAAMPGDEVMVEVSLDGRLKHQLGDVLDSMVRHTASPIRLHVMCRYDERDFTRMSELFPEVSFVWLPPTPRPMATSEDFSRTSRSPRWIDYCCPASSLSCAVGCHPTCRATSLGRS